MATAEIAAQAQPRSRFEEFDIARTLAILGLPIVHVLEEGSFQGVFAPGFEDAHMYLLVLSALGAPLFMACMGANMVFSRHATPRDLARRGVLLLVMGVLLNLARFAVPDAIFGGISGQYSTINPWPLEVASGDIYDFAGLCFLVFALFKLLGMGPRRILAASACCLVAGAYFLPSLFASSADTIGVRLLGRLFWMNADTNFPLLTWMCFPAMGYAFGCWYKGAKTDEARWGGLRKMMVAAAIVFAATAACVVASGGDLLLTYASPANDYITDVPNVLLVASTLVFTAAVMNRLAAALRGGRVLAWFVNVSRGIVPYYACQWILVGWLETAIEDLGLAESVQLEELGLWVVSAAIIAVSLAVSQGWLAVKARLASRP